MLCYAAKDNLTLILIHPSHDPNPNPNDWYQLYP